MISRQLTAEADGKGVFLFALSSSRRTAKCPILAAKITFMDRNARKIGQV